MWDPQHLTNLQASKASYGDSFFLKCVMTVNIELKMAAYSFRKPINYFDFSTI
jgi:hypothetical protein